MAGGHTLALPNAVNGGLPNSATYIYRIADDSVSMDDEIISMQLTRMILFISSYTIGTPSSVTVIIRSITDTSLIFSGAFPVNACRLFR